MPLRKTVAMERRIDLASLFCLIARHGPAVLMTLVVIGCSVAGFFVFRNMREKRRRRRRQAGSGDGDAGHRDAALGPAAEEEDACVEEEVSRRGSTDASDEEHGYRSHVRHRRAAPERTPYKDKLPDGDSAVGKPPYSFFWHRYFPKAAESHVEETRYNSERSFSHTSHEDVTEEVCAAKEPELINDVGYEEKEKVIEADSSEDITSTTEDVSDEEFAQEEDTVHFTFNSQSCCTMTDTLSANVEKENAEETYIKQQEIENSIAPVLKQDEIPSDPRVEDQEDQAHNVLEQDLPLQCGESDATAHFNYEQQADIPYNDNTVSTAASVEVMEESLVEASHNQPCESEPLMLVDTKDDCSLPSTTDADVATKDLSSNNRQQTGPPMSLTSVKETDQNGLCPHEQSHLESDTDKSSKQNDTGFVKMECPEESSDDGSNVSNLEAVSHSVAEVKSVNHQEMTEREETESSLLSENTSAVQSQQSQEILPHIQEGSQAYIDNLSDQENNVCEEKLTLPICKENNLNNYDLKEGQSLIVDFKHEECSVHLPSSQSQLNEAMKEETGLTGFTADVIEEISTVTDTTLQTNPQERLQGTPGLDTETILPPALPSQTECESNQTCHNEEAVDASNISATTRDKIESMVEQMVAEVYKDVTQSALEAKSVQLEENTSSEPAQDTDSIAPDNLACKEAEREVVVSSDMEALSTEEVVNSDSCVNISKADEVQNDVLVVGDASENKCSIDISNIMITDDVPNPQDTNQLEEEKAEHLVTDENVENKISDDTHLVQQIVKEIKPTQLEENTCLEQHDESVAPPNLNINSIVDDGSINEPIVKVEEDVCSNMATQRTVSCVEVGDIRKVDEEKGIQSGIEAESIATTNEFDHQSEPKEPEMHKDIVNGLSSKTEGEEGNLLLEKAEDAQEIPSGVKVDVVENTATLSDVQSEQQESGMLLDTTNVTVKSKVVIICRTLEANVSTVEMSDSEDDVEDGEMFHLDQTSSKTSGQDRVDINRNPANEETHSDVVARRCDTLAAKRVIEEMTTEEKQLTETVKSLDLTSHVTLDVPQDRSASMESTEQVEQKDNGASTPSLESGISSMSVSPEKEDRSKVIGQDVLITCQVYAEEKVSPSVFMNNGVVPIAEEDSVSMESKPLISSSLEVTPPKETSSDLSITNEDLFGGDIEDCYYKGAEKLMTQVVDNIKSTSDDVAKETFKKCNEKKEQACAVNEENGEKVDSDKTEISIMEATMDHNEWITDGNYQVLPWMTAAGFSKDPVGNKEEKDAENKPQASTAEESVENAKKVLAVQPMPQNVNVTFRIHYVTLSPLQTVAVIGDLPELGAWKSVVPLEKTKDGYWTCVVSLPVDSHVEWKFVVLEKGEVCRWEECGNRLLHTGYGDDLLVHKWWGFL